MPDLEKFSFHGDELDVVHVGTDHYVVLARLCDPLGLRVDGQAEKLRALPWARTQKIWVRDSRGQEQETVCLDIRSVAGWLFTINAGKVATHLRDKLALYQRECADVLADHFLGRRGAGAETALLARMVDTIERLEARIASLEARPVLSARPSLGAAAKLHVLGPLMEVARLEARGARQVSPATVRSLRKLAEDRLRERLGYHRTGGQSWAMFPQARLGELHCELARLQHEARKRAAIAAPTSTQLQLVHSA